MRTAVGQGSFPESALETVGRGFAAAVPAIVIAYSVIIDPLINLQPVAQRDFSGAVPADLSKSTLVAQLLVPTLFVMLGFLATIAPPRRPASLLPVLAPLMAFLGLALLSSAWSPVPGRTFVLAVYQILLCTLLVLSITMSDDPSRVIRNIFWVFAIAIAINLVFVIIRPPGPIGHQGIYPFKNTLGSATACGMIVAMSQFGSRSSLIRLAAIATLVFGIVVLIASESKTAIGLVIAAPATAFAILFLSARLRASATTIAIGLSLLVFPALVVLGQLFRVTPTQLLERGLGDATFTGRTHVWSFVASHIEQAPILGRGYRGFWGIGDLSPKHHAEIEFIRNTGSSHNGFLDITLDLGVTGLSILVIIVVVILARTARAIDGRGTAFFLLSIALFVVGRNLMESVILWSTFFDNLLFLLAGLSACYMVGASARHPSFTAGGR